jgi:hypothetical protein
MKKKRKLQENASTSDLPSMSNIEQDSGTALQQQEPDPHSRKRVRATRVNVDETAMLFGFFSMNK